MDDDVVVAERSEAVVVVVNASSSDSEDELCLYCGRCCSQPIMYFAALVAKCRISLAKNGPKICSRRPRGLTYAYVCLNDCSR